MIPEPLTRGRRQQGRSSAGWKERSVAPALEGGVATLDWPPVPHGVAVRELA